MRKHPRTKLVVHRESILRLEAATLQAAAGGLFTQQVVCQSHRITCVTCFGTCTC
jgi:hypothetical protein